MRIAGNGKHLESQLLGWKECQARREPMDEIFFADGTDFSGGKESCQGYRAQCFLDGQGVMMRIGEQPGSPPVTGKQDTSARSEVRFSSQLLQQSDQILKSRALMVSPVLYISAKSKMSWPPASQ